MAKLGVNIDHVATLRQARGVHYPDPVQAALIAQEAGADSITVHLREDRRHIQLRDVELLAQVLQIPLNLEMAATDDMLAIAERIRPHYCCIVPEKRQELTTEGGLDVLAQQQNLSTICRRLQQHHIRVSLFIDPDQSQVDAAFALKVPAIELHTGAYAHANTDESTQATLLQSIQTVADYAQKKNMIVNAGHGLHYRNVQAIAALPTIHEINIGHSIVAHAVLHGMHEAVSAMKRLVTG